MAYLFDGCLDQATDNNGNPISGALMYIYLAGTTTLTPSYTDETAAVQNTNPVVADSTGRWPPVYFNESIPVRVKATNVLGSYTLYDVDYVSPPIPDSFGDLEDAVAEVVSSLHWGLFADWDDSPPTIPAPMLSIDSDGYNAQGIGVARYIYDATVDSDYVDDNPRVSFLAADGRGFRLDPQQDLHIEKFGGVADCPKVAFTTYWPSYTSSLAAPTATDNIPALDAAIRYCTTQTLGAVNETGALIPILFMGTVDANKCYYFASTIIPPFTCHLQGAGAAASAGPTYPNGTVFRFPPNTVGIKLNHWGTQPVGYEQFATAGSLLEGIWFQGGGGTNRSAHGVWHRVPIQIRNCVFHAFAGNNIHNIGYTGLPHSDPLFGATSGFFYENVTCQFAGNWNTWIEGSDVSASTTLNLNHKGSRCGGLMDAGYFGNSHIGYRNHQHGDANLGACWHGGRNWVFVSQVNSQGASTTPGTNLEVWRDWGAAAAASTRYPAWSGAGSYELSVPAFLSGTSVLLCQYIENYYLPVHVHYQSNSQVIGGEAHITGRTPGIRMDWTQPTMRSGQPISFWQDVAPSESEYALLGSSIRSGIGGVNGDILVHGRGGENGGTLWTLAYDGKDIRYGHGRPGGGHPYCFRITGFGTTTLLGGATAAPYGVFVADNFALGNPSDPTLARRTFTGTAAPASGYHAQGEYCRNSASTVGQPKGWYCTVSGTPGTWVSEGNL